MKPTDIDYARDIFTELVAAIIPASDTPNSTEAEALAEKALSLAEVFAAAQQRGMTASEFAPQAMRQPQAPTADATFTQVAADWLQKAVKRSAGHSRSDLKSRFERYVLPHLGTRAFAAVASQEILSVLKMIASAGHPAMAYATFRDLRFLYRYALAAGLTDQDPTATLRRAITKPLRKGTHMITDPASVGRLLVAIRQYSGRPRSTAKYMLRLLPLVFLRASELRTLEWSDVDLDSGTVVVPATRMKMRRSHLVPLARQAVRILRDVQKMTGSGRYVFTSGRGADKPLDFSIFHFMLGRLGYRKAVSAHGFRVLASTWLNEQGWPAEVIERQLSHLGSDRTRRLYNHAEYLDQRRLMMQDWADHLEALERKSRTPLYFAPGVRSAHRKEARHAAV